MIKTEMLRVFVEVARARNLSTAAEALGRAPSALSMTLKQLEENLGEPLFETERKSRLTPLGAFVLELAEREISHVGRTRTALADFASGRIGDVRIACVPSFSVSLLPRLAADFSRWVPGVRLDIRDLDSGAILHELECERVDVGVVSSARPSPSLNHAALATDSYGLFLLRDHPLCAKQRLTWADLIGLDMIDTPLCDRLDVPALQVALASARIRARNTTTLLAFVRAGLGAMVLPELVCRDAPSEVVFRKLHEPELTRSIDLLWRAVDTPAPAAAAFIRFTKEWMATEITSAGTIEPASTTEITQPTDGVPGGS